MRAGERKGRHRVVHGQSVAVVSSQSGAVEGMEEDIRRRNPVLLTSACLPSVEPSLLLTSNKPQGVQL